MGFPWIVIMHKGQQATTATEGKARATGRASLEPQQTTALAVGGLQLPLQSHLIPCSYNQTFTNNRHSWCGSFMCEVLKYTIGQLPI